MSCEIKLTPAEMLIAAQVGIQRQVQNLKNGAKPAYGAGRDNDWQLNIEGALGEMALAKFLGVYWDGKGEMRDPDVGNVDVRTTPKPNNRLILHTADPDDRRFYLLTGYNGEYIVRGSIMGWEGKHDKYWTDPGTGRPAYFVPQQALKAPERGR